MDETSSEQMIRNRMKAILGTVSTEKWYERTPSECSTVNVECSRIQCITGVNGLLVKVVELQAPTSVTTCGVNEKQAGIFVRLIGKALNFGSWLNSSFQVELAETAKEKLDYDQSTVEHICKYLVTEYLIAVKVSGIGCTDCYLQHRRTGTVEASSLEDTEGSERLSVVDRHEGS